jgi:hypothetical protein
MNIGNGTPRRLARVIAALVAVFFVLPAILSAHRVIGRKYPTLATALVQSPNASTSDFPIPLWNTGLSVVCLKVTNTSPGDARITGLGLDIPGVLSGFALIAPVNSGATLVENVGPVEGFPGVALDVAVITTPGLDRGTQPTTLCISGPFDPAVPIETLLNGVFVAFQGNGGLSSVTDIGVWERR